ncbi:type I methionyl aminopeptidase [Phaeovibrio sulfidiphilus]|uniref:Methionine aminopeptidase n=1 Tax=Phaeovibrio sulfidiphilus TaxID=1220600 RepID=A0A8J6Z1A9_9PROT|nr:type I methionyl aminopeptidase [Phaeovibrio sulfidiphilus]MBE1237943.1 type I methionyl aminopeptidase [Phaeovibrio sulfidiphilus]
MTSGVTLHGPEGFAAMRKACRLAAETLDYITPFVKPGISTEKLDDLCAAFIADHGALAAPLNYKGYPKSTCISVNHVVCHGIPSSDKILKDGDILNIDVTTIVDGWFGDTSRMYIAGEARLRARRLIDTTYDAMMLGIRAAKPGNTLGDVGHAIQAFSENLGYSIVRDFCGHGIGQVFHEQPNVLHFGRPGQGLKLVPGMIFTIEPMLNIGRPEVKVLSDGWTAVTRDKSLSAQFEHTVGITEDGCEIFTLSPTGMDRPPYSS